MARPYRLPLLTKAVILIMLGISLQQGVNIMRTLRFLLPGLALCFLAACGASPSAPAVQIAEFSLPIAGSYPRGIVAGPDGNLWFTEFAFGANQIGRITPGGKLTEFPLPEPVNEPDGIVAGPDGNLWFTEGLGNAVGRDGALWFTEETGNRIGRITTSGTITEFPAQGHPLELAVGADGNLWFTQNAGNAIGRLTPAGALTLFPIPTAHSNGMGITAGPDGNIWFTEIDGNK